ncbi:hypothetical protein VTN77DRAFT_171 [Rasamsonia byssochlamydoides]|uniref:uncharacterized protein n=1 Tax=Rasamsonia byssochlamydoides TaxID=89139 RepID=UPI0037442655
MVEIKDKKLAGHSQGGETDRPANAESEAAERAQQPNRELLAKGGCILECSSRPASLTTKEDSPKGYQLMDPLTAGLGATDPLRCQGGKIQCANQHDPDRPGRQKKRVQLA